MSSTSPNWKRPSAIMKLHRRKKVTTTGLPRGTAALKSQNGQLTNEKPMSSTGQKRKNPFSSSPRKKANLRLSSQSATVTDSPSVGVPNALDSILQTSQSEAEDGSCDSSEDVVTSPLNQAAAALMRGTLPKEEPRTPTIAGQEEVPAPGIPSPEKQQTEWPTDWSLKTKARFMSPSPFSWCCPLKTQEEAVGLGQFVRCQSSKASGLPDINPKSEVNKCRFKSCCMVWMHPHISWLKLFPRMTTDNKIGKGAPLAHNEDIHAALMADWTESLSSAFYLTRAKQCPYFYVCGHQFSVVFRAAGFGGRDEMHALLGPTSRGFREAMKAEGIDYTLPLYRRTSGESATLSQSQTPDGAASSTDLQNDDNTRGETPDQSTGPPETADCDNDDDDDDISRTDDGASSWLHDLGLDTARYRSLDPNKVKLQRETFREIDHRAESTVLVEGHSTLALYNFLLNCRSCVANTGIQQGIPPTILAPVAFRGATLQSMKVKSGSAKQQTERGLEHWYSLEIWGPLLPSNLHSLATLFRETQKKYMAAFSVHEPTTPLNIGIRSREDESCLEEPGEVQGEVEQHMEELRNCGVSQDHVEMGVRNSLGGKRAIRELSCLDGHYTWTT